MQVWRLNLKTDAAAGVDPRAFCIERGLAAMGWPLEDDGPLTWDEYLEGARATYGERGGWKTATRALHDRMQRGDLCWTRDLSGIYYIGRITGDWEYLTTSEHRRADMVNARTCEWLKVGAEDAVPGKVVRSFIPSSTLQRVLGDSIRLASAFIYNEHPTSSHRYELNAESADVFSLMSAQDCEDLVAAYLQDQGYLLIPSTCRASTPTYEFIFKHRKTGDTAAAQVKNGSVDLRPTDFGDFPGRMFLFTSGGDYIGPDCPNVTCISRDELLQFLTQERHCVSDQLKAWLDLSQRLSGEAEA